MRLSVVTALLLVGACAAPPPPVAPPPPLPATSPVVTRDWRDLPLTPGTWSYADGVARFADGAQTLLLMRCDRATHSVEIEQPLGRAGTMTLITSYGTADLPTPEAPHARIRAADPLLDRIAFSRGRFSVQASGAPQLVAPSWAEVSRVIEECRL